MVLPLVYLLWTLIIAGAAAASMTSEHEDDTWTSLTATDLTGREIILAKLFGSLWRARRLFSVVVLLLLAGIGAGSLHYLSLPSVALATAVYGGFAAALGVWVSIQLRSTWRAQFLTIALLLLVNVSGQGVLNTLAPRGFAPQVWPGFTPYEIAKLVMEPPFFDRFQLAQWPRFWRIWDMDDGPVWLATFSVMSLSGYASARDVPHVGCAPAVRGRRRPRPPDARPVGLDRRIAPARPAGQRPAVMSGRPASIRPVSLNSSTRRADDTQRVGRSGPVRADGIDPR